MCRAQSLERKWKRRKGMAQRPRNSSAHQPTRTRHTHSWDTLARSKDFFGFFGVDVVEWLIDWWTDGKWRAMGGDWRVLSKWTAGTEQQRKRHIEATTKRKTHLRTRGKRSSWSEEKNRTKRKGQAEKEVRQKRETGVDRKRRRRKSRKKCRMAGSGSAVRKK